MAKDNKVKKANNKSINNLVSSIRGNMDALYRNTYFAQTNNKKDLNNIKADIDASIDDIINANINNVGVPNISQLYNRLRIKNGEQSDSISNQIENLFDDKSLTDSLMVNFTENRYIRDYDEEIDIICKYMPSLEDALDAKKDNVLSADHFAKDFLNVTNKSNVQDSVSFSERINLLKKKYNLIEVLEDAYDHASKYGEAFIYNVSYNKALSRLLSTKNNTSTPFVTTEAANDIIDGVITESFEISQDDNRDASISNFNVELNVCGVIESLVLDYKRASDILNETSTKYYSNTVPRNVSFEGLEKKKEKVATDGLIDVNSTENKAKVNVPGSIVKRLKRDHVLPIYIDDLCLGYYYIEHDYESLFGAESAIDPMMSLKTGKTNTLINDKNNDNIIKTLSSKLSTFIDSKFINANQDLSKEIYMILKHNDIFNAKDSNQFKVTFIPPEDITHIYFKKDPVTHRGISDLDRAIIPAKLYASLYMTGYLGIMTRGHDKRVYYVKQNVDTNISKVLLNTINQIKKGNMGTRELTSVKSLLNITGRYNDYIIPVGASGDSPINFEVMQGQDIDIKQDLLDLLEHMAVNSTDVPYEYIQSRQNVDYAVRLTMSSGKFLRKAFKRQAKCEIFFSVIMTKLYNTEFEENDDLEVELPPPAFLNLLNTNSMIANINETVTSILEMEMADEQDEFVKAIFVRKLKRHYLGGYLDLKNIESLKEQAYMEAKIEKHKQPQE